MRRMAAMIAAMALAQCSRVALAYLFARLVVHWCRKYGGKAPMVCQAQANFGLLLFVVPLLWCWFAVRKEREPGSSGLSPGVFGLGMGVTLGLGALMGIHLWQLFRPF